MKIRELYSDESKWTRRVMARTEHGGLVDAHSPMAVSFCLMGAIKKCYPEHERMDIVRRIANRVQNGVARWNDDPERLFKEVKALVEELDI